MWYKTSNLKNNFFQHKFSKKKLIFIKFNYSKNFLTTPFRLISLTSGNKNIIGLFKDNFGTIINLPLIGGLKFMQKIYFYKNFYKSLFFVNRGSVFNLRFLPLFSLISNLGYVFPKFAISFGTYCLVLQKTKFFIVTKLSSGVRKKISLCYFAILGRNVGVNFKKEYLGKASTIRQVKTLQVRGVAKNPIDHPNGGRTRGKNSFRTPWGLIARKNK